MRSLLCLTAIFFYMLAISCGVAAAQSRYEIGIDRSNMIFLSENEIEETFKNMHALHAIWFRDVPASASAKGIASFVDVVRHAKQQGLRIDVNIAQLDADYDGNNQGAPKNQCGWPERKLSQINPVLLTQKLHQLFDALKAENLTIDAFEIGNEDDSHCYNADVPSGHQATPQEIDTALRGYAKFLKTAALVIRDPHYFPNGKIITFGIAHSGDPMNRISDPAAFVARLHNVDGVDYLDNAQYHVDGYGTHIYSTPNNVADFVGKTLRSDATSLKDRPLWVTEWGFLNINAFPNKSGQTLSECLKIFLDAFERFGQQIPFGPLMFYRYDEWLVDREGHFLPQAEVLSAYAARR